MYKVFNPFRAEHELGCLEIHCIYEAISHVKMLEHYITALYVLLDTFTTWTYSSYNGLLRRNELNGVRLIRTIYFLMDSLLNFNTTE
jgi:hypothetical protein